MDAQRVHRKLKVMERYIERYYWDAVLHSIILSGSPRTLRLLAMMEIVGSPLKRLLWLVIVARIIKLFKVSEMEDICQSIFLDWRTVALKCIKSN